MGKNLFILISVLVFFCHFFPADAAVTYGNTSCIGDYGNYTDGSLYEQNLNLLLSNLSSQADSQMFYNSTIGDVPNKVYGLYLCRGDVSLAICNECIQDAARRITGNCPLFGEAIDWHYECILRYANRSIFSLLDTDYSYSAWIRRNVSNYDQLEPVLATTLNSVIDRAAVMSPEGHFAVEEANWTSLLGNPLYCLAQCTPDIDERSCRNCLTSAKSTMINCCDTSQYVMILLPSCQLRYDTTQKFYYDPPTPISPPSISPSALSPPPVNRLRTPVVVGIALGASLGFILLLVGLWLFLFQRKPRNVSRSISHKQPPPTQSPQLQGHHIAKDNDGAGDIGDVEFTQYNFSTLKAATGDFSPDNKLGEGGFGVVYMGILNNGQPVAIKRLSGTSGQGGKEFMTEARLVAKLQHKNLVKLLGFCSETEEKLLVYEFLTNTSLDRFLFDPRKRDILDWETRFKIIMGIARGVQYLHEDSRLTIIHRDLKPSNILLDRDMNPKIADFGMARLFGQEQKQGNTSRIVGTHGYMAPEYMLTGEYSDKSDVYSFGIIILELVSGQKNRIQYQSSQREDLTIQAWKLWNAGRSFDLMDATLYDTCSRSEVMRCIQIGLLCVQANAVQRPTMAAVVIMLTGSVVLPVPSVPAMSPQHFNAPALSDDDGRRSDQSVTKSAVWRTDLEQDLYPR